jgi:hypothetical protein
MILGHHGVQLCPMRATLPQASDRIREATQFSRRAETYPLQAALAIRDWVVEQEADLQLRYAACRDGDGRLEVCEE